MDNSLYLLVLKDSFISSLIFTSNGEFAYPALLRLNKGDTLTATLYAFSGSIAGIIVAYLIFYAAAKLLHKMLMTNPSYPSAQHYVDKLSPIFGLLIALPKIYIIPVFFFGITKLKFRKFIIIAVAYRILYYIYAVNTIHPVL